MDHDATLKRFADIGDNQKVFFPHDNDDGADDEFAYITKKREDFETEDEWTLYVLSTVCAQAKIVDSSENAAGINDVHPFDRANITRRQLMEKIKERRAQIIAEGESPDNTSIGDGSSLLDLVTEKMEGIMRFHPDGELESLARCVEDSCTETDDGSLVRTEYIEDTDIYKVSKIADTIHDGFSMHGVYPLSNVTLQGGIVGKILAKGDCHPSLVGWMVVWPPLQLRVDAVLTWYSDKVYKVRQQRKPVRGYDLDEEVDGYIENENNCVIDMCYIGVVVPSSQVNDGKIRKPGEFFDSFNEMPSTASPTFFEYRFVYRTTKGYFMEVPLDVLENVYCKPLINSLSNKITKYDLRRRVLMHDKRFLLPLVPPSLIQKAFDEDWPAEFKKMNADKAGIDEEIARMKVMYQKERDLFLNQPIPTTTISHLSIENHFKTVANAEAVTSSVKPPRKKKAKKLTSSSTDRRPDSRSTDSDRFL